MSNYCLCHICCIVYACTLGCVFNQSVWVNSGDIAVHDCHCLREERIWEEDGGAGG